MKGLTAVSAVVSTYIYNLYTDSVVHFFVLLQFYRPRLDFWVTVLFVLANIFLMSF